MRIAATVLLVALLVASQLARADGSSTPTPTPTDKPIVDVRLGLIWDTDEAGDNITSLSKTVFPALNSYCPNSSRVNFTNFEVVNFTMSGLPRIEEWKQIVEILGLLNFAFFGVKQNAVTDVLSSIEVTTSLAEFPKMQLHVIAPMSQSLLLDAFMKVIRQRISESQYPNDKSNFKAAIFIDNSVSVTEMYPMFSYFREGCTYYRFNRATMEANLLAVRYSRVINIVVIMQSAADGRVLKEAASSMGMFINRYRWFIHGPRLINEPGFSSLVIPSQNITSIEFGRVGDVLPSGVWSTTGILMFDLMSIWRPYLKYYLCNEKQPVNQTLHGFSGHFKLNPDGSAVRTTWQLEIYSGLGSYSHQVGEWRSDGRFEMLSRKDAPFKDDDILTDLRLNTFKVGTLISPPYIEYKPGAAPCTRCKEELTGMYIEICKAMLHDLGITDYEFDLQADNSFGAFDGTTWTGILKTVMDGKVGMACAPVTISSGRSLIVEFTETIHSSRLSLLHREPYDNPIWQAFQFIAPLHWTLWLSVLGVLLVVAIALLSMHKIAPNKDANYNFYNSMFFSFAEVVQGTSVTTPKQTSGRILVSFFWFFTLFLFLTYVANYAVFRTLGGIRPEVTSLESLVENRDYQCGSLANTVTDSLLSSSTYLHMQQVYFLMTERFENGTVSDMQAALRLINDQSRHFVLINDNLQNDFYRDRGCELISTGDFYDLKNALVLPKINDYGHLMSSVLSSIAANISALQAQFFTVKESERPNCLDGSFVSAVRYYTPKDIWTIKEGALTLADTLGITFINLFGCCIALALAGIERGIGRMQMRRSNNRRKRQVEKAGVVKFRRPSV